MTKRLVGIVKEQDAPATSVDFISFGLKAFSHRESIQRLFYELHPVFDVVAKQLPRVLELGKELAAQLMPNWQTGLAVSTGGVVCVFTVEWAQHNLKILGYDPGTVDGIHGERSRAAVRKFQIDENLLPDEWPGKETCAAIQWRIMRKSRDVA